ncbi:alpha/beta fold hydrolase [Falsihalocynthiibacter sp. SS001]|uniref:alpha/beta fold hydrolase n=1 Tax=Falsihalocynthiibacter sp. SS001 TaxID=3349698 RepID=UPI0036D358B6
MPHLSTAGADIHWIEFGNPNGAPIIFAHTMAANAGIWQPTCEALDAAQDCRLIAYDLRGHGKSGLPSGRTTMGAMIRDAEQLLEALEVRDAVFVGQGIGGMIAQGLAVKRLDLVRGLVLVNTAARLCTKSHWANQIERLRNGHSGTVLQELWNGWFSRAHRNSPEATDWQEMLRNVNLDGLSGAMDAISGTDFYTPISGLRLPTLGISAYNDLLFPPDLMRETVDVIPGSEFQLMPRVGHMSMLEAPEDFAMRLDGFLTRIGHRIRPDA